MKGSLREPRLYFASIPYCAASGGTGQTTVSPTMTCDFETRTGRPSGSESGELERTLFGSVRSLDWGRDAVEALRVFSRKTRMMVIISIIAVMFRKLISGSRRFRAIALRSSRLYTARLAGGGRGGVPTCCGDLTGLSFMVISELRN